MPSRRALAIRPSPKIAPATEATIDTNRHRIEEIGANDATFRALISAWQDNPDHLECAALAVRAHRGKIHLVDVDSENPENFRFSLWGASIDLMGLTFTARRIIDQDWTALAQQTIAAYAETRDSGLPRYDVIHLARGDFDRVYARLLLPTTDADGHKRLIVAINPNRLRNQA